MSSKAIDKLNSSTSSTAMLENVNVLWNPCTGEYMEPPESIFGKLYCRKIQVYPNSRGLIKHIIGKGGKHFYHFTTKYNLVYIYYHDHNIEIWGEKKQNVHVCIHEMIEHMRDIRKQQYKYKCILSPQEKETIVEG